MRGRVAVHEHALLVRKRGDPALAGLPGGAPCCTLTPGIIAQQLGRPTHTQEWASAAAARGAAALGWPADYPQRELEGERLFDYAALAPPAPPHPLALLTCMDTRLAGAGSPRIAGTDDALAPHSTGRGKRLAIVPAGHAWATSADEVSAGGRAEGAGGWGCPGRAPLIWRPVSHAACLSCGLMPAPLFATLWQIACDSHWSGWQEDSPHALPASDGSGRACSAVCTREGTLRLAREAGLLQQYAQGLLAASYGALSLSPDVAVLPEVRKGRAGRARAVWEGGRRRRQVAAPAQGRAARPPRPPLPTPWPAPGVPASRHQRLLL